MHVEFAGTLSGASVYIGERQQDRIYSVLLQNGKTQYLRWQKN